MHACAKGLLQQGLDELPETSSLICRHSLCDLYVAGLSVSVWGLFNGKKCRQPKADYFDQDI